MMTRHYKVAGFTFAVSGSTRLFEKMGSYEPFECEGGEPLFTLTEDSSVVPEYTEVYQQRGGTFIYGRDSLGNDVFEFTSEEKICAYLVCSKDCREGRLIATRDIPKRVFDGAMMMMFALATAEKNTLIIHAVVVSSKGKGYLFLGCGGTGKSTHARLWIEHIEGTELVNDDYPVVRDGVVYGSPWGRKTPCYRNVSVPIGGFVMLSQAYYNKIHRLSGIEAYMNLGLGVIGINDSRIAEGQHQTKNRLASTMPMWHLECLPDEAAARLCHDTITQQKMMTRYYKVAGHTFAVSGSTGLFEKMGNYEPFECKGGEPLFSLIEDSGMVPEYTEEYREEDRLPYIICGSSGSGNDVFEFKGRKKSLGGLICSKDYREGRLIAARGISEMMLNTALMMMFVLATAGKDTLLVHAAVVGCEGKGYLFLGPSGTGKSTHARLWIEHVEGTELVNDDNPVVRGGVVYGSPWSGKTPCYRNVSVPIGGIVMLSQASYNKIRRLSGIEAYVDLAESVGGKVWDSRIAEGQHQTMNKLASTVPMWHLECLPDEAAARLCYETIKR